MKVMSKQFQQFVISYCNKNKSHLTKLSVWVYKICK